MLLRTVDLAQSSHTLLSGTGTPFVIDIMLVAGCLACTMQGAIVDDECPCLYFRGTHVLSYWMQTKWAYSSQSGQSTDLREVFKVPGNGCSSAKSCPVLGLVSYFQYRASLLLRHQSLLLNDCVEFLVSVVARLDHGPGHTQ